MISTTPAGNTNHAHSHNHAHSILKPPGGNGGTTALSLALEKAAGNRARMDSQKFLIPSLPVSSRPGPGPDPGGLNKRRDRGSIVNGTASLTPATPEGGGGYPHPHSYNNAANYSNGVRRGYSVTGLPPPTNSPRKDAHSPMYHSHHIHPLGAGAADHADLHLISKNSYLGQQQQQQHRSSVPIPCSSPARAASASPKSAAAPALSPSSSATPSSKSSYGAGQPPALPGVGVGDRLYTAGFPHHPNLGVSSHAAALYAAAAAAAQPLPYAALFGGYPHSAAATNYLDSFHSSIMAQQQKHIAGVAAAASAKPAGASPPGGRGSEAFYPPTATTSFHTKLIDSALPIERLYNNGHHPHAHAHAHNNHNYQAQAQAHAQAQREERDRDVTGIHAHSHNHNHMGFPGLPNGVSVSVSKGSPGERRLGATGTPPNFHPPPPASSKYFNSNSKLSLTNVNHSTSSIVNGNGGGKYWNASNGHGHAQAQAHSNALIARQHGQTYQATSPGLLGKQLHEDYKSSILYGGKEGSLKHRILKTGNRESRSPEPPNNRAGPINSPVRTSNPNAKPVFQFPNLMSGPTPSAHAHLQAHGHAHLNGSTNHSHDFYDRVNNNGGPFNYSKNANANTSTAESEIYKGTLRVTTTTPPTPPFSASSASPPFKYLSQIYKPSNPRILSPATPAPSPAHAHPNSNSNSNSPAHLNSPTVPSRHNNANGSLAVSSPKTPTDKTSPAPANIQITNGFPTKKMNEPLPIEKMPRLDAFQCGSLIQLAGGDLRAVEDLRVEDFIKSAAKAADALRIIHCTIISIQSPVEGQDGEDHCKVTLAMGTQKQQVVVDTTPEQPFFIPGRGWSSWSPIQTQRVLQLPCSPLAVGDVCITLSKQEAPLPRSPLAKAKATTILSSPNSAKIGMAGKRVNGYAKRGRAAGVAPIPRKLPKGLGLEAQAMLPPPTPLTPRTISKISAVIDPPASAPLEKEKSKSSDAVAILTSTRPVTPKKRRWSAPDVVTDEDSGEDTAATVKTESSDEPPVKIKVTDQSRVATSPRASASAPPITVTA